MSCDLHLFEVYVKGFLEGCGGALTDLEVEMLPMGAILMTFECGMRFLADHLEGDHYIPHSSRKSESGSCKNPDSSWCGIWNRNYHEMKAIVEKYK